MEKLLNIYIQVLFVPGGQKQTTTSSNSNTSSSNTIPTITNSITTTAMTRGDLNHTEYHENMMFTWNQFAQFCTNCCLWFLKQSLYTHHILLQCTNLTLPELNALREVFLQYDIDLSNNIPCSDLFSLLQVSFDMYVCLVYVCMYVCI